MGDGQRRQGFEGDVTYLLSAWADSSPAGSRVQASRVHLRCTALGPTLNDLHPPEEQYCKVKQRDSQLYLHKSSGFARLV